LRGRTATIALGGFVILGLPTGMLGVAWPSMRGELDAPLAGLGLVLAAMTATEFGSSALSGIVRERFGTALLLLLPTALAAVGLLWFALAETWSTIIVAAAVLGAGLGLLDAAVNTEAALRRGIRFMGALHASWAVGATLGPLLIGLVLVVAGSWRLGYAVAALAFVAFATATYFVRGDLAPSPEREDAPNAARGAGRASIMGAALMFVYVGIELGAGQWSFTRLTAESVLTDALAGLAVFLYWSALAAGRVALAVLGARVPPAMLIDLSVAGVIAGAVAFWILPPPIAALIALPSIGLALSVFVPLLLYLIPRRVGHAAAPHVIGYLVAAGMIGGALLPAGIGVVLQWTGVASLGICLSALAAAFGGLHLAARRDDREFSSPGDR
jgi:fucose permease